MSVRKFLDPLDWRELARDRRAGGVGLLTSKAGEATEVGYRTFRFCFSDGSVDRMGDTIAADGWDLRNFNKNPVCLWSHASNEPPIGRASGLQVIGERLMGNISFAEKNVYDFADTVFRLVRDGYVNAVSVGFLPLEWSYSKDPSRPGGVDFIWQELLEISVVSVPANAGALVGASASSSARRDEPLYGSYTGPQLDRQIADARARHKRILADRGKSEARALRKAASRQNLDTTLAAMAVKWRLMRAQAIRDGLIED